jgi:hypothetical protein
VASAVEAVVTATEAVAAVLETVATVIGVLDTGYVAVATVTERPKLLLCRGRGY